MSNKVIELQMYQNRKKCKIETSHLLEDGNLSLIFNTTKPSILYLFINEFWFLDLYCSSEEEDDFIDVVNDIPPDNNSQQIVQAMDLLGKTEYNSVPETFSNQIQGNISIFVLI